MPNFTPGALQGLRVALAKRTPMIHLCGLFRHHTRDEVVEAIDAVRRFPNSHDATRHVNQVLALKASGVPLVNGKPQSAVCANWYTRPKGMF